MRKQVGFQRLVFIAFSFIAVTLDTDIAILGVQNLLFGRLGASIFLPWGHLSAWGHRGGPWEQQEGHVGPGARFLMILGRVWDPILKAFWVCFQATCCIDF